MRFLPLIWSGIWRKPGRTNLIFLQVSVAFALFGVLQGLKTGVEHVIGDARADLLLVHSSLNVLDDSLPLGLFEGIKSVPGVKVVAPVELFRAIYQNPSQKLGIVAIRPDEGWLSAFTFTIAPDCGCAPNSFSACPPRDPRGLFLASAIRLTARLSPTLNASSGESSEA